LHLNTDKVRTLPKALTLVILWQYSNFKFCTLPGHSRRRVRGRQTNLRCAHSTRRPCR
jgi:hypothetical protein